MFVETSALSKCYGRVTALDQCSISVAQGEVFGLLGPNGAGKTTLLRILLGYLRPSSGEARVDGLDCRRRSVEVRRRTTYLPGEARLFRTMRGNDVLRFFAGMRTGGNLSRAQEIAQLLELDLTRRVAFMSTGMRQKLALAVTLSPDVPLLILDEPTANLDPTVRASVIRLVLEAKQSGKTIIFSSHVLSEVEESCDRAVILRAGKVVHTQVLAELRRRHRILASLDGPLPPLPAELSDGQVSVERLRDGEVLLETAGSLSPLLGWLAELPVDEVRVEPIRLRAVYDRFHGLAPVTDTKE